MTTSVGKMRSLLTVAFALALFAAAAGDIIYVKSTGSNTEPYDTEAKAATTLSTAVPYANAQGIRKIKVIGQVLQQTQLTLADVEIYGDGWSSANVHHTAGYKNPVFTINGNVLIHGIKFTANTAFLRAYYWMTADSSVISNCWFTGFAVNTVNDAKGESAGHVTAGLITHCLFSKNMSRNGGNEGDGTGRGLLWLSGTARMANSIFTGNYHESNARGPCDGLLVISGDAVLESSVIYGNYTQASSGGDATAAYRPRRGGGVFVRGGSPTIRNCIVRDNLKPHAYDSGATDIYKPTEQGNFYIVNSATPTIQNCNVPSEDQIPDGAVNCQTNDPKFVDAAAGDFAIAEDSPCVDAGVFALWQNTATDYSAVTPRYQGEGVDIGAYEIVTSTTPIKAYAEIGGQVEGYEKEATVTMEGLVAGYNLTDDDCYEWYTANPEFGHPSPFATGRVVTNTFYEGTWSIYLKVVQTGPMEQDLIVTNLNAVTVLKGADYYVSATGSDDSGTGSISSPFKTVAKALTVVTAKKNRIKIVGLVQETANLSLQNVEVFADDWTTATWKGQGTSSEPRVTVGANAFVHGIKFDDWRVTYGLSLTADSACVSNCWINNMRYSTGGTPAGTISAGLVTHTLYTACTCNYGPILTLTGTGTMRSCIMTGNIINNGTAQDRTGIVNVSGSATIENCTFSRNYVTKTTMTEAHTGGLRIVSGSPTIRNSIIRDNWIDGKPGASGATENNYLCLDGATPTIEYCAMLASELPASATDCVTDDPLFVNPGDTDLRDRGFSIQEGSPCRNTGKNRLWQKFATDFNFDARRQGGQVDMGACEYPDGVPRSGLVITL